MGKLVTQEQLYMNLEQNKSLNTCNVSGQREMNVESSVSEYKFLRHHHCLRRKISRRRTRKPTKDLSLTLLDCSRLYAVVIPVIIQHALFKTINHISQESFFKMIVLMIIQWDIFQKV